MKKIYLNTPEAKRLVSQLLSENPVVLTGSGISSWEPTLLPTGMNFSKVMFALLFPSNFLENNLIITKLLNDLWNKIPFEHLLEKCPNHKKMTPIIKNVFHIDRYNPIHEAIVDALIDNNLRGIITTNYDLCLDKLLSNKKNITRVVTDSDFKSLNVAKSKVYFKIHGSADDNKGETLVWALRHENYLSDWKRYLLLNLIEGKTLLIIGYSGLDFEICPEILNTQVKNIYWNILNEDSMTPNAHRIRKKMTGAFLIGDMQLLMPLLTNYTVNAVWGKSSNTLIDSIKSKFTKKEIGLWRASLLNSIGCASISYKASNDLLSKYSKKIVDIIKFKRERARALFHLGKYFQSAKEFHETSEESNLSLTERITMLLDSSDSYRCYGKINRAKKCIKEVRREILKLTNKSKINELNGIIALKEVLILGEYYRLAKKFKIQSLTRFVQRKAESLLQKAAKMSIESGNLFDFQQTRLWAKRMNISPRLLAYQIPYEPPPPKEGYEHLQYYVAQSMNMRDEILEKKGKLTLMEESNINKYIKICREFKNYPELWKLSYLGLRRGSKKKRYLREFLKAFFLCEYTFCKRIVELILKG